MARCKDCIHHDVCETHEKLELTINDICELEYRTDVDTYCKHFKPTADVVPRSEVEALINERETYKAHSYNVQTLLNTINQKISEGYELSVAKACAEMEMWQKVALKEKQLTDRIDNLIKNYYVCMKDYTKEIFGEIDFILNFYKQGIVKVDLLKSFDKLKSKYMGEN